MKIDPAEDRAARGAKPHVGRLHLGADSRTRAPQGNSGELEAVSAQLKTVPNHQSVAFKALSVQKCPRRTLVAQKKIPVLAPKRQMAPGDPPVLRIEKHDLLVRRCSFRHAAEAQPGDPVQGKLRARLSTKDRRSWKPPEQRDR